ncbi:hypothetical protein N7528_010340 [Penicillium herquei]|nr:hypothetical protein N7528_010340 [Penicillium herquei]
MASSWQKLTLQQPNTPPLLYRFTWAREGYTLYVTDLTFVWSEELSHQEILKRAEEKATTIDPSEDHDQFNVLLEKIGETLRGEEGTTTINSGAEGDSLHLTTKSKLPAPLRPLLWEIRLSKQASTSLTNHLLLPLLRDEAGWESRQRFLLDQLKQKDWILGRIFDKIDTMGVDLGTVFPGAAGLRKTKKGSTRSEAARFIKGLAPFDESKWLLESGDSSESSGFAKKVLNELLGSEKDRDLDKLQATQEQWWTELPVFSETASFQSTKSDEPAASPDQKYEKYISSQHDMDLDLDGASTASEDEFQRQETPPRLKAKGKKPDISPPAKTRPAAQQAKAALSPDPGEATASDSESEEIPAAHQKHTTTPPQPRTKKTAEKAQPAAIPDLGESTESDSEPDIPAASKKHTPTPPTADKAPQPEPQASPKKAPKARGGLGVIGGKKKKEERPPSPAPISSPPSQPAPSSPETVKPVEDTNASPVKPKRATKIGMIGGKGKNKVPASKSESVSSPPGTTHHGHDQEPVKKDTVDTADTETAKAPTKKEVLSKREEKDATPVLEETEAQKTARKREELKRQLAEKSKAPKKRRRF